MLEKIDTCRTAIFDKTGTLTYGKPRLTEVVPAEGHTRDDVLAVVASLEQYSKHPLAAAVMNAARAAGLAPEGRHRGERTAGPGARRRHRRREGAGHQPRGTGRGSP